MLKKIEEQKHGKSNYVTAFVFLKRKEKYKQAWQCTMNYLKLS